MAICWNCVTCFRSYCCMCHQWRTAAVFSTTHSCALYQPFAFLRFTVRSSEITNKNANKCVPSADIHLLWLWHSCNFGLLKSKNIFGWVGALKVLYFKQKIFPRHPSNSVSYPCISQLSYRIRYTVHSGRTFLE